MAAGNHLLRLKIAAGMIAAFITGTAMGALMAFAGGILAGSPLPGVGIALGVAAVIAGMVSVGAIAVQDARNGTETAPGDYIRRAMLSTVTISAVSEPVLFGVKRLTDKLFHKEKKTWKAFLQKYELATVICYGITHIPNRCMINVVKLCTIGKVSEEQIEKNAAINEKKLEKRQGFTAKDYIENQAEWGEIQFGSSTMAYSGCEIMAVYNALHALGKEMALQDMVELISAFERKGAVLQGTWGCSSYAVYNYFVEHGYETAFTCSRNMKRINEIGERCDTVVLTAYNNQYDIRSMIHTISVTKDENGHYTMHNAYKRNKAGEYAAYGEGRHIESLQEIINLMSSNGLASPICAIGISTPKLLQI